jgi:hypothetical protein
MFLHYGTGLWTNNTTPDLGKVGDEGGNIFDNCATDSLTPPWFSDLHVVADSMTTHSDTTLWAVGNFWCPVHSAAPNKCYSDAHFTADSGDTIIASPCALGPSPTLDVIAYFDRFGTVGLALKTQPFVPTPTKGPIDFALYASQPNPFNPLTVIRFDLPVASERIELTVYDSQGRVVRQLVRGSRGAGSHQATWDGRNDSGSTVASGVYFYRLHTGSFDQTRKMVLLK